MAMGRPREFDVDKALDLALQVFWRKGYEGASMADLTETMGITKPSLYSAFGNKEELFRKALDRYVDGPGGYFQAALAKPTTRAVVENLLYESADAVTDPNHPPGCLAVQGAPSCGDAPESIKQELMSRRAAVAGAHVGAQQHRAAAAHGRAQPRDPFRRLPIGDARIGQPAHRQDRGIFLGREIVVGRVRQNRAKILFALDRVAPFRPFRRRQRQRVVEHGIEHVNEWYFRDDAGEQFT